MGKGEANRESKDEQGRTRMSEGGESEDKRGREREDE